MTSRAARAVCAIAVAAASCGAAAAETTDPAALASRAAVRDAALALYVHGITERDALRDVGAAAVPALLELLREPGFPRRDNVVAFLVHLGDESAIDDLAALAEAPGARARPEDDRAWLLSAAALGAIARRTGSTRATARLRRVADTIADPAFRRLALRELERGRRPRPRGGAVVSGTGRPVRTGVGAGVGGAVRIDDPATTAHAIGLGYANHVDLPAPDRMTDAALDQALAAADLVLGRADGVEDDVACCVGFERSNNGATFGVSGDGLDVLDDETELTTAAQNGLARAKIVRLINWCGEPATNVVGCAFTPGNGMVLVRVSPALVEGILWAHEYGHNAGLEHVADETRVMNARLRADRVDVSAAECSAYHAPPFATGLTPRDAGTCRDLDADGVHDLLDNCDQLANPTQADADGDGVGDSCEVVSADFDGSGRVDGFDLARLARAFGAALGEPRYDGVADLDRDGDVDGADLATLAARFGGPGSRRARRRRGQAARRFAIVAPRPGPMRA